MVIKAHSYENKNVGKHIKKTKTRFTWVFSIDGEQHTVQLFCSWMSSKRKVVCDEVVLFSAKKGKSGTFRFPFNLGINVCTIINKKGEQPQLMIGEQLFSSLYEGNAFNPSAGKITTSHESENKTRSKTEAVSKDAGGRPENFGKVGGGNGRTLNLNNPGYASREEKKESEFTKDGGDYDPWGGHENNYSSKEGNRPKAKTNYQKTKFNGNNEKRQQSPRGNNNNNNGENPFGDFDDFGFGDPKPNKQQQQQPPRHNNNNGYSEDPYRSEPVNRNKQQQQNHNHQNDFDFDNFGGNNNKNYYSGNNNNNRQPEPKASDLLGFGDMGSGSKQQNRNSGGGYDNNDLFGNDNFSNNQNQNPNKPRTQTQAQAQGYKSTFGYDTINQMAPYPYHDDDALSKIRGSSMKNVKRNQHEHNNDHNYQSYKEPKNNNFGDDFGNNNYGNGGNNYASTKPRESNNPFDEW